MGYAWTSNKTYTGADDIASNDEVNAPSTCPRRATPMVRPPPPVTDSTTVTRSSSPLVLVPLTTFRLPPLSSSSELPPSPLVLPFSPPPSPSERLETHQALQNAFAMLISKFFKVLHLYKK